MAVDNNISLSKDKNAPSFRTSLNPLPLFSSTVPFTISYVLLNRINNSQNQKEQLAGHTQCTVRIQAIVYACVLALRTIRERKLRKERTQTALFALLQTHSESRRRHTLS